MQMFRALERDDALRVGWGGTVLLASPSGIDGPIARHLAGLGGSVEISDQLYNALALLIDDSRAAQILVVDCDSYGGFEAGHRGHAILAEQGIHLPVILISKHCAEQIFPPRHRTPILLRAPVSPLALRVAFDAAFQGRRLIGQV